MCIALILSFLNVGSLIIPSCVVAFMTAPNTGVIGILHPIVSLKLMVLLVPDMSASESTIQFNLAICALFIETGAIDIPDLGSCTGVESREVPRPPTCDFPAESVVDGVYTGDVGL